MSEFHCGRKRGKKEVFYLQQIISLKFFFSDRVSGCHQVALCFLIRILSFDSKYKDVFRDVGVLEVLTNCLKQYADGLKEKYDGKANSNMIVGSYYAIRRTT